MIASLAPIDGDLRTRISEAAEGNPLFVEQMVALVKQSGTTDITVPPTISALLAARLEQLDDDERSVLERGAIEGRIFHRGAVDALGSDNGHLVTRLTSLVRKELLRPDKPMFAGDDAFRFRHMLIRDAAYDAMPKAVRADLHERFATWLRGHQEDLVEWAEVLGYHLERAYRYRLDLGVTDGAHAELGRQAAELLAVAGRRAFDRSDLAAAASLLERAAALLSSPDAERADVLQLLGRAQLDRGHWEKAAAVLREAGELADALDLPGVAAEAILGQAFVDLHTQAGVTQARAATALDEAARLFEAAGDQRGLARAMTEAGRLPYWRGETAIAVERFELAATHARQAGDTAQQLAALGALLAAMVDGATPVTTALARVEELAQLTSGVTRGSVGILRARAELELMLGDYEVAAGHAEAAAELAQDLGLTLGLNTGIARVRGRIALALGDVRGAESVYRSACTALRGMGDIGHLTSMLPLLADALYELGRIEEIADEIDPLVDLVVPEDMDGRVSMRRARAKLLASRGDRDEAERVMREALQLAEQTDYLPLRCDVLSDLGELLVRAGRPGPAATAFESALALYEQKGSTGYVERTRARLAALTVTG
jgi:tetratricopeptide (TPR) repeat protein